METMINKGNPWIFRSNDKDESQTNLDMIKSDKGAENMRISVHIYKHIDDICQVLQAQSCSSDVKLLMFAAAANSEGYRSTLVPIPPLFMGKTFYDIEQLRRLIANWSNCHQMLMNLRKMEKPTADDIHLLHWVLISQGNPILRHYKISKLAGLCRNLNLVGPSSNPQEVLSVYYKDERRNVKSNPHYAYLGCPLEFLYRLLIMGRMDNFWTGPLRLYNQADPALAQCTVTKLPLPSKCWSHSRFGRAPRCVLICEVLQDKIRQQLQSQTEIIIYDTSCLRIRYLLIFTESYKSSPSLSPARHNESVTSGNTSRTTATIINSSSFENRFKDNKNSHRHRFRGNRGSRWIFRIVGWVMGRVVRIVQRQQRATF